MAYKNGILFETFDYLTPPNKNIIFEKVMSTSQTAYTTIKNAILVIFFQCMDIHRCRPGKKKTYKNLTKNYFCLKFLQVFTPFLKRKRLLKKIFVFALRYLIQKTEDILFLSFQVFISLIINSKKRKRKDKEIPICKL